MRWRHSGYAKPVHPWNPCKVPGDHLLLHVEQAKAKSFGIESGFVECEIYGGCSGAY